MSLSWVSKTWFKSLTHCNNRPLWVPYGNPTHRQLRNRMTHSEKSKDTQNNMKWFPCMHSVCLIYGNLICVVLLKQKIQSGFSTNFSKNIQLVISICSPEAQQWTNTMQEKDAMCTSVSHSKLGVFCDSESHPVIYWVIFI